jgi:hypothetical protein
VVTEARAERAMKKRIRVEKSETKPVSRLLKTINIMINTNTPQTSREILFNVRSPKRKQF